MNFERPWPYKQIFIFNSIHTFFRLNMKNLILLFWVAIIIGIVGCGSPKVQRIRIDTGGSNVRFCIDTNRLGGYDTMYVTFANDGVPRQITAFKDGYDTVYTTWYPDPDYGDCFRPEYKIPRLKPIVYRQSNQKMMHFRPNHSDKVVKYPSEHYSYSLSNYLSNSSYRSKKIDSLHLENIFSDIRIYKYLATKAFTDTNKIFFHDNANNIVLKKVTLGEVVKDIFINRNLIFPNMVEYSAKIQWRIENVFGDTLLMDTTNSKSALFCLDGTVRDEYYFAHMTIKTDLSRIRFDAIRNSLNEFMEKPATLAILAKDTAISPNKEWLKIPKPAKVPKSLDEAIATTVTIKCDKGHGSGFVVSNDGYIVTNYHVIADKKEKYRILTHSGAELPVTVVRYNQRIDLALLKVDTTFDMAFALPDEKNFSTANDVLAIGTPQSLELVQTVSKGVISSFRTNEDIPSIQMDARINGGNSGGPVVNDKNEMIGVSVAKLVDIGVEGISFAIPAFLIKKALSINY